tara:strand:- start:3579 stop:4244 length:666 start_codon:yes stop_codon:yes gene_type:complete
MKEQIPNSWENKLRETTELNYFSALSNFINSEYDNHECYPKQENIFTALKLCPFEKVKAVVLGQDPYHGAGQADGLSFSVPKGQKHPPSLINIFKEIHSDLNITYPKNGNLERWAKQGVLLLNATLTVRANEAGSHQKHGWEIFTDTVIQKISNEKEDVVFLLWGGFAKKKKSKIDDSKHFVISSGHPSPLSANRGYWFGNKHFSKCNEYLKLKGKKAIDW